jgi:hypothetical protein
MASGPADWNDPTSWERISGTNPPEYPDGPFAKGMFTGFDGNVNFASTPPGGMFTSRVGLRDSSVTFDSTDATSLTLPESSSTNPP